MFWLNRSVTVRCCCNLFLYLLKYCHIFLIAFLIMTSFCILNAIFVISIKMPNLTSCKKAPIWIAKHRWSKGVIKISFEKTPARIAERAQNMGCDLQGRKMSEFSKSEHAQKTPVWKLSLRSICSVSDLCLSQFQLGTSLPGQPQWKCFRANESRPPGQFLSNFLLRG